MQSTHHDILIIGGGSAGITVAARLLRKRPNLSVGIIEPNEKHYYQPAWTLVGAGAYKMASTIKNEKDLIPAKAHWIKAYAQTLQPEQNQVVLHNGQVISYQYLVVAAGIQLNWGAIPGLKENIGKNGVCSNYHQDYAPYTWECLQDFKGGTALFTQAATPIKCGGAPQKIMYLAEDFLRKKGLRDQSNVVFASPGSVIFGVKKFAKTLSKIVSERDIHVHFYYKLVEIRGEKKEAVFEINSEHSGCSAIEDDTIRALNLRIEGEHRVVIPYEILHLAPPQSAPDFIKASPLAKQGDPYGWVEVDKHSLQHTRFENVFALGDVANTPNAKTGAAVRKQAPVLVQNLLKHMDTGQLQKPAQYNGYGSCPLVTRYGRMVLAEFDYSNKPTPSFPFNTAKERYSMWLFKKYLLPWLYWKLMLRGKA